MPILPSKIGSWELPHVHLWRDRDVVVRAERKPLIRPNTRIATIGSCFAQELAAGLGRFGLSGGMHPAGLFYNTRSIRQELERACGGWPERHTEPMWRTRSGFVHPFKPSTSFENETAIRAWSDGLDAQADNLLHEADLVVVTLGLIECWRSRTSGNVFRQIPHPEAFEDVRAEFFRISVREMLEDLEVIRTLVQSKLNAKLIITVSPIPLFATVTPLDVRVANTESKARIRAAVSEFIEAHDDVSYFHSYEMVSTAEQASDFMLEDGRHVHSHAVDFILSDFLRVFAADGVAIPKVDSSFITEPTKTALRPNRMSFQQRTLRSVKRRVRTLLERRLPR